MTGAPNVPDWPGRSVLAVCAHPDDESFGLGAVLADAASRRAAVSVLCFTHGESSTLSDIPGPLGEIRKREFEAAATVLGLADAVLLDYPDGGLPGVDLDTLSGHVESLAARTGARLLLAFDTGGVTGHPDHHRTTEAALRAAGRMGLPVLGWAVPQDVASTLNEELGTRFAGRAPADAVVALDVDRTRQEKAIACHHSQAADNRVLRRRLELHGRREYLVRLH